MSSTSWYSLFFFIWNNLGVLNPVWRCNFLKFKIWIDQSLSNKKMRNIKVVDINNSNKFYIYDFFSWD